MKTLYQKCPLFEETLVRHGTKVMRVFEEFLKIKDVNAMQQFGSKDYPFMGPSPLGQHKPRLMHAGMTYDISLIYMITGRDPHVIKLIGFFTHDELGTGQPARVKSMQRFVQRVGSQKFA